MGICKEYNPNMYKKETDCGKIYSELLELNTKIGNTTEDKYHLHNCLERLILFENCCDELLSKVRKGVAEEFLNKIKILSMTLQRLKASDWNNFVDLAMNSEE